MDISVGRLQGERDVVPLAASYLRFEHYRRALTFPSNTGRPLVRISLEDQLPVFTVEGTSATPKGCDASQSPQYVSSTSPTSNTKLSY
jgi:hypothetical protein